LGLPKVTTTAWDSSSVARDELLLVVVDTPQTGYGCYRVTALGDGWTLFPPSLYCTTLLNHAETTMIQGKLLLLY
jgi:hypothetical protein